MTPKNRFEEACTQASVTFSYQMEGRKVQGVALVAPENKIFIGKKSDLLIERGDKDTKGLYDAARKALELLCMAQVIQAREEKEAQKADDNLVESLRERCGKLKVKRESVNKGDEIHIKLTAPVGKKFNNDSHEFITLAYSKHLEQKAIYEAVEFITAHVNKGLDKCDCNECYSALIMLENESIEPATSLEMGIVRQYMQEGQSGECVCDIGSERYKELHEWTKRLAKSIMQTPRRGKSRSLSNQKIAHMHYYNPEGDLYVVELDPFENEALMFFVVGGDLMQSSWVVMGMDDVIAEYKLSFGWKPQSIGAVKQRFAL